MRKSLAASQAYTIVELVVVIFVIGIITALVYTNIGNSRERGLYYRSETDLRSIASAAQLYAQKYGAFPADVSRDIPAEIKEFIDPNVNIDNWPNGAYPGSVFDWESWDILNAATNTKGTDGINDTFQISLRFCPVGGPLSACTFPKQSWATGFNINSAAYWCIKGYCRPHSSELWSYPGYCINCPNHAPIKTPDNQ